MKFMVHACTDRMWYVNDFLVPSMLEQGIPEEDITVKEDVDKLGTLKFYLRCFNSVPDDKYGTWHLQDDVVLSKTFKERAEQLDDGLVNGFCSRYCKSKVTGIVTPVDMWYSFPCIRIPNVLAHDFVKWFSRVARQTPKYGYMIEANKFVDALFMAFIRDQYPNIRMRNISPNLIDHVDYLIGGSTINTAKVVLDRRAAFWDEEDVVIDLEQRIEECNYGKCRK